MIVFKPGHLSLYLVLFIALFISACNESSPPVSEVDVLGEAHTYLVKEQYEQAESTLVAHAIKTDLSAEGHLLLGRAKVGLFDDEGAIQEFKFALGLESENLEARLDLVRALRRMGLLEDAFSELESVDWEEQSKFRYEVGQIKMQSGEFEEAIGHFERVLALDPGLVEGYYTLGTAYQRVGRTEEGQALLATYQRLSAVAEDIKIDAQIVDLNPESADAHYNLARAYENAGEDQLAISYYMKAIALDGEMREAYNNLGIVFFRLNEDEKAVQAFQKAISISDTTAKYYFNLGAVYARRGVLSEAEKLWRKTLELDPGYEKAREFLQQIERAGS